jgi:hypothetical protein
MAMLGDGSDILRLVVIVAGGDGVWPELAGRFEQRAAQVLQEAEAVAGHGQAAPSAAQPGSRDALTSPQPELAGQRACLGGVGGARAGGSVWA